MNRFTLIATLLTALTACGVQGSSTLKTCPETCEADLQTWVGFCTSSHACDDSHPRNNSDGCHNERALCMATAYDMRAGCYTGQCAEQPENIELLGNVWRGISSCLDNVNVSDVSICYEIGSQ